MARLKIFPFFVPLKIQNEQPPFKEQKDRRHEKLECVHVWALLVPGFAEAYTIILSKWLLLLVPAWFLHKEITREAKYVFCGR